MNKEPFPGYNSLVKGLLDSGDYEEHENGIRLKGLKDHPGQSGIFCPNMKCQHDLYVNGVSVCSDCLKLETRITRTCCQCKFCMRIL